MHLGLQKGPRTKARREAKEFIRTPPGWGRSDCQARTPEQPQVQLLFRGSEALGPGRDLHPEHVPTLHPREVQGKSSESFLLP